MKKRILMVLTSHRLDCFRLCMDLLIQGRSIYEFDRVVLLLNGVQGPHLRYICRLQKEYADVVWDVISGPRGRGACISSLQNACVERYPDSIYFKIDEDTFVSADWAEKLYRAYRDHAKDGTAKLFTPVIPNNGLGFSFLLRLNHELHGEFARLFPGKKVSDHCDGVVWLYPQVAEWITRHHLRLNEYMGAAGSEDLELYERFGRRFSINCICYDYHHWDEMGGVPEHDEVGWGEWIEQQEEPPVVLVKDALVHHYAFFVQQTYLDRTSLLEDIRTVNLPGTLDKNSWIAYEFPRWRRMAMQLPGVVKRKVMNRK